MKPRLVKYTDDGWQWEIYSRNGGIVCSANRMFPSKKAARQSLDNFLLMGCSNLWLNYTPPYKIRIPVLDCSE